MSATSSARNSGRQHVDGAESVPDLLQARAAESPDAVALVVDGGEALSYGDWEARSDAVARGLADRGTCPGDRVALLFDNDRWTDYAVCYLGVQKAGAAAVPLGRRFAGPELEQVLGHSGASGVVSPEGFSPPPGGGWAARPEELEDHRAEPFPSKASPGGLAEIIYTSGTTGSPKGVACSHASLVFYDLPADPGRAGPAAVVMAHAFPVGTNAGQECLRLPLRRAGRTAVVLPLFDPARLCAVIEEHGVTRLQLVPAMAQMLLTSGAVERHDVSSVERVTLSSAPVPPALLSRLSNAFPNASVWNAYALTESGSARTLMRHDEARPGSVGRPVGQTEVRVVGEDGEDAPAGSTGEVWLRRRGAPRREYYRDPASTAAAFSGDWLRTGDLGYLDGDGYLYLVDRLKDVIISGGLNVSSVEVEDVLHEHPDVLEAAVFGMDHPVLGQDVAAAVVTRGSSGARDLQAFVRRRLGEHKVPRRLFLVEGLPRNVSGKVLKRVLRERFATEPVPAEEAAPLGEVQERVVSIWRDVLHVEEAGVEADFFDLGGHSLAAAQVVARLRDAFHVELPVTAVFEWPTVRELAAAVEDARLAASEAGRG